MKTKDLAPNQAVAVEAKGTIEFQEGDIILVGVKCIVQEGKFIPITPGFRHTKNMFTYCDAGELVPIKRID